MSEATTLWVTDASMPDTCPEACGPTRGSDKGNGRAEVHGPLASLPRSPRDERDRAHARQCDLSRHFHLVHAAFLKSSKLHNTTSPTPRSPRARAVRLHVGPPALSHAIARKLRRDRVLTWFEYAPLRRMLPRRPATRTTTPSLLEPAFARIRRPVSPDYALLSSLLSSLCVLVLSRDAMQGFKGPSSALRTSAPARHHFSTTSRSLVHGLRTLKRSA